MLRPKTKKKIVLAIIIIIAIYTVCFGFLTYHEFKEWTLYPFFESMIGVFMGAGAIALITGIILIFQSALQSAQEKTKEVFDRKLTLYEKIIKDMNEYFKDGMIDEDERRELFLTQLNVALLSSPETFKLFSEMLKNISDEEGNLTKEAPDKLLEFIKGARKDLDVQREMTDKDTDDFDAAFVIAKEEAEKIKEYTKYQNTYLDFWERFNEELKKYKNLNTSKPNRDSWKVIARLFKGVTLQTICTKNSSRIEINIDAGNKEKNKEIFNKLKEVQTSIENQFGDDLIWQQSDDKSICKIYYENTKLLVTNQGDWDDLIQFFIKNGIKMQNAFNETLKQS